jgi:hypothetical protein
MKVRVLYFLVFAFIFAIPFSLGCNPYWVPNDVNCQPDDTYILTYYDFNNCTTNNPPALNGSVDSCNYCSQNLQSIDSACVGNETNTTWVDLNYYSCCDITGLASDCEILTEPYNSTETHTCFYSNLTEELGQLECQIQPNMGINDKEYCIAHIPLNYTNETFKCIALIRNGNTNEIIQTTPQYKEMSQTFITFFPESDTRQWFTPANNIVNFYYTGKNLNPDTYYILAIECSSTERTLKSEMVLSRAYEDMSFVFFRTRWLMSNTGYLIALFLLSFFLIVGLIIWWRMVRV